MPTLAKQVCRLLLDSLVRVTGVSDGSGFFITPDAVLTCAHVAGAAGGTVQVRWSTAAGHDELPYRDLESLGTVRWASPLGEPGGIAPYPDLAVVELKQPPADPHVVWLDDHLPAPNDPLYVAGHEWIYNAEVERAETSFRMSGHVGDLLRLAGGEVPSGTSGGPVLNLASGGVCAVVKAARKPEHSWGGVAVPVGGIRELLDRSTYRRLRRAHDGHHRRNRLWIELADQISAGRGMLAPQAECQLRTILAQLPDTNEPELRAALERLPGAPGGRPRYPLYDHADVVVELAERANNTDEFPAFLAFLIDLARTTATEGAAISPIAGTAPIGVQLTGWLRSYRPARFAAEVEKRLTAAAAAPPAPVMPAVRPSVMVRIRPAGHNSQRYRFTIWHYRTSTDAVLVAEEGPAARKERIWARLQKELPGIVLDAVGANFDVDNPDRRLMIELIVPSDLMDVDIDLWKSNPKKDQFATFGQDNHVVIRELARFEDDPSSSWKWHARWQALHRRGPRAALHEVTCQDRHTLGSMTAWFAANGDKAILVLPDRPEGGPARVALTTGLPAGVPVMIWRRDGCTEIDGRQHSGCRGKQLGQAVRRRISGATPQDIPEQIRQLRADAWASLVTKHCGRQVVLLWDDPRRHPPRQPLVYPRGGRNTSG